jgi:hypothetical protein
MEKLKEAIKYLAYLSGKKPHRINKIRLTKLLWIFEGIMYVRTGKRPLGLRFMRNKHGIVSPDVDLMLTDFWTRDKKQTKNESENKNKHLMLKAMDIPEIQHLSAEEVALLSWLYNVVMTRSKSPIDEAMADLPSL